VKIAFRRFQPGDEPAIARANERLRRAGLPHVIGAEPAAAAAGSDERPIAERMFLALEGAEVRGSVWLKEQLFWSAAGPVRMGWMVFPLSESLFDRRFAGVPGTLLFGLLREQPRLMALGMGGAAGPFAKLLAGARWSSLAVPFWFRVVRPARCLRRLSLARRTRARRLLGDLLAGSGAAWLGHALLAGARRLVDSRSARGYVAAPAEHFDAWADAVWLRCRGRYGLAALRDARSLEALYPPGFQPLARIRVRRGAQEIGWVCAQAFAAPGTPFESYFGDLRVGVLTDGFGDPADAVDLVDAGVRHLLEEGVDVVVTNQLHPAWCAAARAAGFWKGPSNLAFSWSPAVQQLIPTASEACHLTRSDCDGPLRLASGAPPTRARAGSAPATRPA
jgi:hypothetical protein